MTVPAPYGPVAVGFGKTIVTLTGHDAAATIWGFRVLAVAGVILAGFGVASIARRHRQSPAVAVAVGVASPLVLLHLIGGSHNDAIMMGLTAAGLAVFLKGRRYLGVLLVDPGHRGEGAGRGGVGVHGLELGRRSRRAHPPADP